MLFSHIISPTNYEIENFSLTSTYLAIEVDRDVKSFIVQNRGENDVLFKRNSTDTKYWTIRAGGSLGNEILMGVSSTDGLTTTVGYAAVTSGTATLEVIFNY